MGAVPAPRRTVPTGLLSIGQVLTRLSQEFPDLTASKLRFLEVKGIVNPSRTDSGYRKFSAADLERLRTALTLQRDHFLPLDVIRVHLDDRDAGATSASSAIPTSITPQARRYSRTELLAAAGANSQLLNEAIATGIITPADSFNEATLSLLRNLVTLDSHGIEPRHLRTMRQGAERQVSLIESAISPLLRRTDSVSKERAAERGAELARQIDEVRSAFVREALAKLLS